MVPLGPSPGHQTSVNNTATAPASGTKSSSTLVSKLNNLCSNISALSFSLFLTIFINISLLVLFVNNMVKIPVCLLIFVETELYPEVYLGRPYQSNLFRKIQS